MGSILARRLRPTLSSTIGSHKKVGDVIQFVDDGGCHDSSNSTIRGIGAAIVGVFFEKAYDLVNREVLWRILDVMGYPTTFVRWLQTMYSVTGMSVLNGSEVAGLLMLRLSRVLQVISLFNEKLTTRAFVEDVTIFVS
ncbi:hypothetical protein OUZ56_018303 [Daphnia magna]|uniref:Reverse transcriptase domain-containing protein n=1 Tax=Daphnia magna TaxID=35525 RepID=A0ABQ9Z8H0_9CRUS|nr:hypothetical protein OUZ56_018303 [Daphnia magna]